MASTPVLYVTANVGSIFEEPKLMLGTWVTEFLKTVKRMQPHFIALHCQEIGGKNYEGSMKFVEDFVRRLLTSEELRHFDRIRVFLDEDFTSSERFTALGNLYFIHESIHSAHIWDFKAKTFVPCYGKEVHSGNIEDVPSKEKVKFSPEFFPECKWSRKGYLHTRWSINGTQFELVNIHLFHDASNFLAIETFPSVYSDRRQKALQHVIDRLRSSDCSLLPFVIFGDFNFRLDTHGVVKRLTHKSIPLQVKSNKNGEISKIVYKEESNENKIILTVGKKEFDHHEHHENFFADRGQWLREFDKELDDFIEQLYEFPINFPPSYPFVEDVNSATAYMKTRCPAWCDRILLSKSAKELVIDFSNDKNKSSSQYEVIGENVCMGDHKPIYLYFRMKCESGSQIQYHNFNENAVVDGKVAGEAAQCPGQETFESKTDSTELSVSCINQRCKISPADEDLNSIENNNLMNVGATRESTNDSCRGALDGNSALNSKAVEDDAKVTARQSLLTDSQGSNLSTESQTPDNQPCCPGSCSSCSIL